MAGVLSRLSAAARLTADARPSILLIGVARSATRRPSSASYRQLRRIHSNAPSAPPELPSWVKAEVRKLVLEVIQDETRGMKSTCLERHIDLSTQALTISKESVKLHADTLMANVETKKEVLKIALRICVTMGGLAVASPLFKYATSGDGGSGGAPPTRDEIVSIIKEEAATTRDELKHDLKVISADHFLAEEARKDKRNTS